MSSPPPPPFTPRRIPVPLPTTWPAAQEEPDIAVDDARVWRIAARVGAPSCAAQPSSLAALFSALWGGSALPLLLRYGCVCVCARSPWALFLVWLSVVACHCESRVSPSFKIGTSSDLSLFVKIAWGVLSPLSPGTCSTAFAVWSGGCTSPSCQVLPDHLDGSAFFFSPSDPCWLVHV